MRLSPSVGEPGYLPYCGPCPGLVRMTRGVEAFECRRCGLKTRMVNGEDMFDRTAPSQPWAIPAVRRLDAGSAEAGGLRGLPDAGMGYES